MHSLVGFDETDFIPDVGPRARAGIKADANGGNKGELQIDLLHSFLDDGLDFLSLDNVPINEGVGQVPFFLKKKVTVNFQELQHVTTYASVVSHRSGLGKDSSHRNTTANASEICSDG